MKVLSRRAGVGHGEQIKLSYLAFVSHFWVRKSPLCKYVPPSKPHSIPNGRPCGHNQVIGPSQSVLETQPQRISGFRTDFSNPLWRCCQRVNVEPSACKAGNLSWSVISPQHIIREINNIAMLFCIVRILEAKKTEAERQWGKIRLRDFLICRSDS